MIEEDVKKQTDVLSYLIENKSWDFFMTFYSATAITQHYFWKDMEMQNNIYKDVIKTAYRSLDKALDRLINAAGKDTNIILFSECGAGPLTSGIQINTWLQKEGFLSYKNVNNVSGADVSEKSFKESFTRSKISGIRKNIQSLIPKSWYFFANKNLHWLKSWIQTYLAGSDIDWDKTYAFSRGKEGDIFINLKGREPKGIVEPGDYNRIREDIIKKFLTLINPATGKHIVKRIYKREELYNGAYVEFAPDLIIEFVNNAYMPSENDNNKDSIFVERWRENMNWPTSGSHRTDGIILAKGPDIAENQKINNTRIIDMTPTWLHLLDQKVPDNLEGKIITGLLKEKVVQLTE